MDISKTKMETLGIGCKTNLAIKTYSFHSQTT